MNAAWALWQLEKRSEVVLPILLQSWKAKDLYLKDECIRNEASQALGEIGQVEPDRVVPVLLKTLEYDDEDVVYAAMYSLRMIGPQEKRVVKALVALLRDRREGVSNYAGWQLRDLGPAVVPPLVAALKDDDAQLRWRAAWTLGGMKVDAKPAVAALKVATADENENVRRWATWALGQIGSDSK
ncbi:hypothetical protein AYO44_06680 [Planctomycetaceae bacterium SCGC AG-212-F19]|nr:hypothetical protein AYO44_06680 [Planctomycetaceae bacterium SCGC AG-212-F19]